MCITHIISNLDFGGAEHILYQRLKHSDKKAFKHVVITLRSGNVVRQIRELGIPVYIISGLVTPYDFIAYLRLKKIVKKIKPDLIHASLWSATTLSRLVGKSLNIPVINDIHSNCKHHGWFRNWCDVQTAHMSRKIISISNAVQTSWKQEIIQKIKPVYHADMYKQLQIIINCIDVEHMKNIKSIMRNEVDLADNDFVIGTVGRLEPIKSHDMLIKAFDAFCRKKRAKLVIIGSGSQEYKLKTLAHSLGIQQRVLFTGQRGDAQRWYSLFDCFVLSFTSEGISLALLEAMSCGVPVITTYDGKAHEVIEHEKTGLLVSVGDCEALTEAFAEVYGNEKMACDLGAAGQKIVFEKFGIKKMVRAYENVYHSLSSRLLK